MKMRVVVVTVMTALVLVAGAGSALAKGAGAATIDGPGGGDPVVIEGDGEPGSGGMLGLLAQRAGFFAAVYGQQPSPLLSEPPPGDLGPAYRIRWVLPGPTGDDVLVQRLYPEAVGGPVTYLEPDQPFWGSQRTVGGWYAGGGALEAVLGDLDLPPVPAPRPNLVPVAVALLLACCGSAFVLIRRRSTALAG